MAKPKLTRRQFNRWLAAGLCTSAMPFHSRSILARPNSESRRLRAAAIQMVPRLGDLRWNMNQAEVLIRQALHRQATWIILPEMFTSAAGFHPDILKAIQPLDGEPLRMMKRLARESNAVIGGSFLASREHQVFNTFVLVFPDGHYVQHDKDQPTYWENCYYRGGKDDGVMPTPIGEVGAALCWEFIRSQTARRLLGKVKLVVGGSCWWTLPDEADGDSPRRAGNRQMIREAAPRMAQMLGVPVIHGSHAGRFEGFFSPALPDVAYNSSYLGEAMIVDARGKVMARRAPSEREGVVSASIDLPSRPSPSEAIPARVWIPRQMPEDWKQAFIRWFDKGGDYYGRVTLPYIKTGKVPGYEPAFMRD